MSEGRMKIIYHPVLKEMRFQRYENGRWVKAGDEKSILNRYTIGENLLQNYGNQFFQDIITSMDGITEVFLDFEGTREDYEDLKKMIENYQNTGKDADRQLCAGDLAELSSVRELFNDVMAYSDETSEDFGETILELKRSGSEEKKEEVASICTKLEGWLKELARKREGLKENAVNLCFVGSYSSGKSTLINALIGESILPESIKSETAKMFRVTQIPNTSRDTPYISFPLVAGGAKHTVKVKWDEDRAVSLDGWPYENPIRENIQRAIDENVGKARHIQMNAVLSCINRQPDPPKNGDDPCPSYVDGIVEIYYPFDLEAGVLFHVYDTPGTDSNDPRHLQTLKAALRDPTSSILVYVNEPSKLEGTANAILLDILTSKEPQGGVNSSTIDLSRSFFVINKADTVKDAVALEVLQNGSLRLTRIAEKDREKDALEENELLEIKLREKRLFFTDALHAGDARAVKKGIAGDGEKTRLRDDEKLVRTEWYRFYRYDIMAQAEAETKRLIEDAERERVKADPEKLAAENQRKWLEAYTQAVEQGAAAEFIKEHPMPAGTGGSLPAEAYYICSGVYSLQKEIERYAERFALAVRAKGIVDGTRDLIHKLLQQCRTAEHTLNTNIADLDQQIRTVQNELSKKVQKLCDKYDQKEISDSDAQRLGLDMDSIVDWKRKLQAKLNKIVDRKFIVGSKKAKTIERDANETIDGLVAEFFDRCAGNYARCLNEMQETLIRDIEQTIEAQKGLDQNAKSRLKGLRKQEIARPSDNAGDVTINKRLTKIGFITLIDKGGFIDDAEREFSVELDRLKEEYKKQYNQKRNELAKELKRQYQTRVDEFAKDILRLKEDRAAFETELKKLKALLVDVQDRDKKLEEKIYKRINQEGRA